MQFVIVDNEGSVLDTFDDRQMAESALRLIVRHDKKAADDLLLLTYDNSGDPAGDAVVFEDITTKVFEGEQSIARVENYPLGTATWGYAIQRRVVPQVLAGVGALGGLGVMSGLSVDEPPAQLDTFA